MGAKEKVAWACVAAAIAGAMAYGMYGISDGRDQGARRDPSALLMWGALPIQRQPCDPSGGSRLPFPVTGPIELTANEKVLADQPAGLNLPQGSGQVTVANEDDEPVALLFVGEDGRPRAKVFIRGSQVAKLSLPAGAYDALYESGNDWGAEGFGSCSRKGKVKGIVVSEPSKFSHVVLFGESMFVLANRIDLEVAQRLEADDLKRRQKRNADHSEAAVARPERDERSARPGAQ
jgi:hypothetical protein